jgi:hypothetical protein
MAAAVAGIERRRRPVFPASKPFASRRGNGADAGFAAAGFAGAIFGLADAFERFDI